MTPRHKRVFSALAGCVSFVGLALLPSLPAATVKLEASPAASTTWLDRLNAWRANVNESNLVENTTWSQGDYSHALYMVKNNLVTHYETLGTPYYTAAGDAAAQAGNIFVSSSTATTDDHAIDWWMGAPFHAMGLLDPRLSSTGFGSYREVKSGWDMGATVDVIRGNPFSGGQFPVLFPGNNTREPLTTYSGNEFPDPLQACAGYSMPTGLPIFIEVGGNVATTAGAVHTFTGNGVPLAHCVIDSTNGALGSSLKYRGGVILIPRQPLTTGVTYTASLTVNNVPYTWSFTVGPFQVCASASLSPAVANPASVGATLTFTAGSTGCSNPRYAFWVQYPDATWHLIQGFGGSTFMWNTVGLRPGSYTIHVWVNQGGNYYDAIGEATATLTGCASAAITPPAPIQDAGSTFNFTASSAGCGSPRYAFWVQNPDASWHFVQGFGGATFSWSTLGLAKGTYTIHVWVNQGGNYYDAIGSATATLVGCATATLSPATGSAAAGSTVAFTASSMGCTSPRYAFWVQYPDTSWHFVQTFGGPAFSWRTAGLARGTYTIHVWANTQGNSYDAIGSATYTLS
jgi:hypothetical protein